MANGKILWLFGDTWYGKIRNGRHEDATIVNNSIAIQHGTLPSDAMLTFFTGRTQDGQPTAFIRPVDDRGWLWIYHGIAVDNGLYLFFVQLERTDNRNSFGFKIMESWLAYVSNPMEPPPNWRWKQYRIPWDHFSTTGDTLFGSSLLREDDFIYIYGTTENVIGEIRHKSMILARVPESQILQFDRWRFYSDGSWSSDFKKSSRLCGDMANEFSVSYLEALERYIIVYTEKGFSENIVVRFAPRPWGPWSEPSRIYACPEAEGAKSVFCYAAKGHPALSSAPDEIIVTYVASSLDFSKITNDATLYRPRFLRVRFEE
jgi:hypothetical protein